MFSWLSRIREIQHKFRQDRSVLLCCTVENGIKSGKLNCEASTEYRRSLKILCFLYYGVNASATGTITYQVLSTYSKYIHIHIVCMYGSCPNEDFYNLNPWHCLIVATSNIVVVVFVPAPSSSVKVFSTTNSHCKFHLLNAYVLMYMNKRSDIVVFKFSGVLRKSTEEGNLLNIYLLTIGEWK